MIDFRLRADQQALGMKWASDEREAEIKRAADAREVCRIARRQGELTFATPNGEQCIYVSVPWDMVRRLNLGQLSKFIYDRMIEEAAKDLVA